MTAEDYARKVEWALGDLPWRQRRDLVAELREHLAELPPDTNLADRLGAPEQYATDMRAAAGLERRRGPLAFLRARRPRNLLLTVLALTVLGLIIGALAWIHSYQPIATGNSWYQPGAKDSPAGDGVYYIFRQGKPFEYGMTIWNSGRFTVRVTGIPIEFELPFKYRLLLGAPTRYNYGGLPGPYRPFRPFDLKPGEQREIVFKGAFDEPCNVRDNGLTTFLTAIPVRYSFLWHTATVSVPLPQETAFHYTKASVCPKAKR